MTLTAHAAMILRHWQHFLRSLRDPPLETNVEEE